MRVRASIVVTIAGGSLTLAVDAGGLEGEDAALVGDLIGRIGDHVAGKGEAQVTIDLSDPEP